MSCFERFLNSGKCLPLYQWQQRVTENYPLVEPTISLYGLWTRGYLEFPECTDDTVAIDPASITNDEMLSIPDDEGEVREKLIGKMKVSADLLDTIFLQKRWSSIMLEQNYGSSSSQAKIFSSLLPNIAITATSLSKGTRERFSGVLLFLDVSGFTQLCESFSASAKDGIYKFTSILNSYLGSLVDTIIWYGGDVFKFSGDALLALWKLTGHDHYMMFLVHKVVMCATYIQINFGSYDAHNKVILKVKAAISAGQLMFSVIGNTCSKRCILVGSPVDEVKSADKVWSPGDVLLTQSAWRNCCDRNYKYEYKDDNHVKILRILYDPREEKLTLFRFSSSNSPGMKVIQKDEELELNGNTSDTDEYEVHDSHSSSEESNNHSNLKQQSVSTGHGNPSVSLRPFIVYPVLQQVEAFHPLKYLTEMRKITTMFVNLIPKDNITTENLISAVDETYCIICQEVYAQLGILNQVFLFDKDITYLVTFGLRGSQHETKISRCLRCAYYIHNKIKDKDFVKHLSLGVTNGMVYSGVVGHRNRKDYTVIGKSVNKAARLMCTYLDKVTCDHTTFVDSNLPLECFILQEGRTLKGITDVGKVYEYTEENKPVPETIKVPLILNREKELRMFESMIRSSGEKKNLIISGEHCSGKSRLLQEFLKVGAHNNLLCVLVAQADFSGSMAYFTIRQVFKTVLGPEKWNRRESYLEEILSKHIPNTDLYCVNEVLQTNFEATNSKKKHPEDVEKIGGILSTLIKLEFSNVAVIIDDGHYVDEQSKQILNIFSKCQHIIFIVSLCADARVTAEFLCLMDPSITTLYQLKNLENNYLDSLVTQFLGVVAIDKELSTVLQLRSRGNPGWCHNYIQYLVESGTLVIEEAKWKDAVSDPQIIIPNVNKDWFSLFRTPTQHYKPDDTILLCKVTGDASLISRLNIPASLEGLIMTAFDSLTPDEQLLLKCSAVMGERFPRSMLAAVIQFYKEEKLADTIKCMFEKRILRCAKAALQEDTSQPLKDSFRDAPVCFCVIQEDALVEDTKYPRYALCQNIKFTLSLFRDITYELLPFVQRKKFHERAINYLKKQEHKCASCKRVSNKVKPLTRTQYETMFRKSLEEDNLQGRRLNTQRLYLEYFTGDPSDEMFSVLLQQINFASCQCANMSIRTLRHMIYHAEGADFHRMLIGYLLDCAKIEIFNGMSVTALSRLQKSLNVVEKYAQSDESPDESEINLLRVEIHVLTGQAYYHCQQIKEAEQHLTRALLILYIKYSKLKYSSLNYLPRQFWSERVTKKMELEILCQSLLAAVSMEGGKWSAASKYAEQALSKVSVRNFGANETCMAYGSAIQVACHLGRTHVLPALDVAATNACFKADLLTIQKAIHLGIISSTLFLTRIIQGQLSKAAKMAVIIIEIAIRVKVNAVKSIFLYFLTQILMLQTNLVDAVNALEDFANIHTGIHNEKVMFYLLCFILLLEAGVCYVKPENGIAWCEQSNEIPSTNPYLTRLHLYICQWLLRMDRIEEASHWFEKVPDMPDITFTNIRTVIIHFECCLLCYVKLKREDLKDLPCNINVTLPAIYKKMKELKKCITSCSADMLPRILFNMAYCCRIQNKKYQNKLNKALQICLQQENYLYKNIIEENMAYWKNPKNWNPNNWEKGYKNGKYVTSKEMLAYGWSDLVYCFPVPE